MRLGRLRRSPWIGVVAAAAALVCAVAAANGPARAEAAVVRWPAPAEAAPAVPGVAEPRGQWYTPLLLSAHSPARLTLSLPCTIAPDPRGPVLVFATTRGSDVGRGLTVIADRATLTLTVRDDRLVRTPWAASSEDCTGALDLRDGTWVLTRAGQVVASGQVDAPDVSGLYTELDPRGPSPVRAEVTAATYGSRPSTRQWVLNAAAVVCAALALLCLGRGARG
ncbi:MAG TPA: hypothetical protein VGQ20_14235, partial [Acidimicrobiales bacterium]|nr:hypothetical protein [Acidimicrobiales bacterium]